MLKLSLLEAQVPVQHGVGAELGAPGGAAEQHGVRIADAEVPRAEELEEHHVGALIGRGVGAASSATAGGEWGFSRTL